MARIETRSKFRPFHVVIETEDEMNRLWHLLNMANPDAEGLGSGVPGAPANPKGFDQHAMWRVLNDHMVASGYREK